MDDRDYLREARGRTLTRGQILGPIVREVQTMAERDEDWKKLADDLQAALVDPDFDLEAPVDLADLMAVIAEHHVAEPADARDAFRGDDFRRDEFPGGPQ